MSSTERILIVDDDDFARSALLEILEMEGYAVEGVGDGISALAKIVEFGPHVVLCDLGMPGMDGLTFIKNARQLGKAFRLVIMSGSHVGRQVATSLGAAYLPKPIDLGRLFRIVEPSSQADAQPDPR